MKPSILRFWAALWLMALLFLFSPPAMVRAASIDTRYHVRLDISPLAGLGLFNAEFQLTDGSGNGNGNSRVTITNTTLTNGQLGAVLPPTTGNVTGNLGGTLLLQGGPGSANSVADFAQGFSVTGSAPSAFFDFDVTLSVDALEPSSSTPDNFLLALLNDDGSQTLPTNGPTGGEVAAAIFDRTAPVLRGYASQTGSAPLLAAPTITLIAPQASAPEPASIGLLCLVGGPAAVATLGIWGLRQRGKTRRLRLA